MKALFLALIFLFLIQPLAFADGESWLGGFSYRKAITVVNSGSALTDYQVNFSTSTSALVSAGKMNSDCSDLRVTDSNGASELNYWIESGCNTASTKVWVKIPSVPVGSKTLYFYYGNPAIASESSTTSVFIREIANTTGIWHLDQSSGTVAPDTSGNNFNGTLTQGPAWAAGKYGNGVRFDGMNDYITITSNSIYDVNVSQARTFTAWFKAVVNATRDSEILWKEGNCIGWSLHLKSTGRMEAIFRTGNNGCTGFTTYTITGTNTSYGDNQSHHVAFVIDRPSASMELFVDNISLGTVSPDNTNSGVGGTARIGSNWNNGTTINGTIDEVIYFARALDDAEISDLYTYRPYSTTSYVNKSLIRQFASTEPTASVTGSEEGENLNITHRIQAKLTISSTTDNVYIPGTGEKTFAQLTTDDYTLPSAYLASESSTGSIIYGVLSTIGIADPAGTVKTASSYGLKIGNTITGNEKIRLIFSKGPLSRLQSRAEELFEGTKIDSFGYPIPDEFNVIVGLQYGQAIIINSSDTIQAGRYNLIVRVKDQNDTHEFIEVRTR